MALGAYAQLDSINADARYHAAVLRLQVGDFPAPWRWPTPSCARTPGHLFGYIVRGTAAGFQGDSAAARRAGPRLPLALRRRAARPAGSNTASTSRRMEDFKQQAERTEETERTEKTEK